MLGDYRLGREVGRGGMGVVYEAEQISMERRVALKVLFPTIATTVATRKRFEREARITGRLHHTNIVMVHAMGRQDGYLYFAMELVEGRPLDEVIGHLARTERGDPGRTSVEGITTRLRGPRAPKRIAEMFAGAADALQVAHAHGVIHRDVKPSNLILDADGLLKLTDFGLARLVGDQLGVTRTGDVLGTPLYMSPEQIRGVGDDIDHRTDVYSLGATMYELLAGRPPFTGTDIGAVCTSIVRDEARRLHDVAKRVPRDLATIVERAMAKDRADRYASAGDLASDLRAFAEGRSIRARPLGPVRRAWRKVKRHKVRSALAALLLVAGASAFYFSRERGAEEARRLDAQYLALIADAEQLTGPLAEDWSKPRGWPKYVEAIDLRPDRPEAYFARALAQNRPASGRLRDLQAAADRGMRPRAVHLARAYAYRLANRGERAVREEEQATSFDDPHPDDELLVGLLAYYRGERVKAARILRRVGERSPAGSLPRRYAFRHVALAEEDEGDYDEAIEYLTRAHPSEGMPIDVQLHVAALWGKAGRESIAEERFQRLLDTMTPEDRLADWDLLCKRAAHHAPPAWIRRTAEAGLALHPEVAGLHYWKAMGLKREGKLEAARKACDAGLGIDDGVPGLHAMLGKILRRQGDLEGAERESRKAIELGDRVIGPHFDLAHTLLMLGRHEEALASCRRGLALEPSRVLGHQLIGRTLRDQGDLAGGIEAYRKAYQLAPATYSVSRELADALERADRREEALSVLRESRAIRPRDVGLWSDYVYMQQRGGGDAWRAEVRKTRKDVEAALETHARSAQLHFLRAMSYYLEDEYEVALSAFDAVLTLDPDNALCWHERSVCLESLGRLPDALASIEKAVALDPLDDGALAQLAHLQIETGAVKAGIATAHRARLRARGTRLTGLIDFNIGIGHRMLEQYDKAREFLRSAVEQMPGDSDCHTALGSVDMLAGKPGDAIAHFRAALSLSKDDVDAWTGLATALARTGQEEASLRVAQEAYDLHPRHPMIVENYGAGLYHAKRYRGGAPPVHAAHRARPGLRPGLGREGRHPPAPLRLRGGPSPTSTRRSSSNPAGSRRGSTAPSATGASARTSAPLPSTSA